MLLKYLFLFSLVLASCAAPHSNDNQRADALKSENSNSQHKTIAFQKSFSGLRAEVPTAIWTESYFKKINQRTREAGIESLQNTSLGADDFEIRVWRGFGLTKLEGFIINRIKETWSATFIDSDYVSKKFVSRNVQLSEPQSGWNAAFQKLLDAGILTLPDAESINCNAGAKDGMSYVVEIKKGDVYRTYMYENPWLETDTSCPEADRMLEIGGIIAEEFGLNEFKLQKFRV
jgi:hypothetical protein